MLNGDKAQGESGKSIAKSQRTVQGQRRTLAGLPTSFLATNQAPPGRYTETLLSCPPAPQTGEVGNTRLKRRAGIAAQRLLLQGPPLRQVKVAGPWHQTMDALSFYSQGADYSPRECMYIAHLKMTSKKQTK